MVRNGATVPVTVITRPTGASDELEAAMRAVVDRQNVEVRAARSAVEEGAVSTFEEGLERARAAVGDLPRVEIRGGRRGATRSTHSTSVPLRS
jgi:hypothetical protein